MSIKFTIISFHWTTSSNEFDNWSGRFHLMLYKLKQNNKKREKSQAGGEV